MLKLTLDHNCLITLENGSGQLSALSSLLELHAAAAAVVYIGGASAAENVRSDEPSVASLRARIERLGLQTLDVLLPEGRIGLSYIGFSVVGADDTLSDDVHRIVHPGTPSDYTQFRAARSLPADGPIHPHWRNIICDVDAMVAHIRRGHDIFVTEDRHFLRPPRRDALVALGAGDILTPDDALARVRAATALFPRRT